MARKYTNHSAELKLKVAIEANSNKKTVNQIASEYEVYPCQVTEWKKQLKENATEFFSPKGKKRKKSLHCTEDVEFLQQEIGKLKVELDWLKKKSGM